jgi:hypothetical protein
LRSRLNRDKAPCATHRHQPDNDWQDAQKEGRTFHDVTKR